MPSSRVLRRPDGLGSAARFTPPAPLASTTAPARFRKTRCAAPLRRSSRLEPHVSRSERFRAIPTIEVLARPGERGLLRRRREAVGIARRQQDRLHQAHDPAAPSRQCAAVPSRRRGLRDHLEERQRRHQRLRADGRLVSHPLSKLAGGANRDHRLHQGSSLRRRAGKGRRRNLSRAWTGRSRIGRAAGLEPHRAR